MYKILVLLIALSLSKAHESHFYRRDYTYIETMDAFYKIHWGDKEVTWNTAFTTCDYEGAELFYPKEGGELEAVKQLTAAFDVPIETAYFIVGIHDEIGHGNFITVDGTVTPNPVPKTVPAGHSCILMTMNEGEYRTGTCDIDSLSTRYFICKRKDDRPCTTIDLSYKYVKETKKCYKVNDRHRSWQDAWHTCYMEGGMLVSIESEAEATLLGNMITTETKYFIGYRKIFPGSDFYTVKGKIIQESGFQRWIERQNNDSLMPTCGTIFTQGSREQGFNGLYMSSENCSAHNPFICEMPVRL